MLFFSVPKDEYLKIKEHKSQALNKFFHSHDLTDFNCLGLLVLTECCCSHIPCRAEHFSAGVLPEHTFSMGKNTEHWQTALREDGFASILMKQHGTREQR